ncbi:hypothetical protein GGR56DRAFT_625139 [Xylariaceae sp. FL0804]|nr:hypothetical protein GGR56DRAFT_625139 [Xylariaceae sp. FL0804]
MKRLATDEIEASSPAKVRRADSGPNDSTAVYSGYAPEADGELSDRESQYTKDTSTGPATVANTPDTAVSPPRKLWPSDLKTIKCTFPGCNKAFNRPIRLANHLRSHTNERPFKCPHEDCGKDYMEEKHLRQHLKASHTAEREYICAHPGCGKGFMTNTRLRRHQLVHEGQERFKCRDHPPCEQSFRKHQTLLRHIRSEHLRLPAYVCDRKDIKTGEPCKQGFENSGSLRRHQEREHGENRFWCDECGSRQDDEGNALRVGFPTQSLLQEHMKQNHINCLFCGQECRGREELGRHIETEHVTAGKPVKDSRELAERKNIMCKWPGCGKTFTRVSNMNLHIRSAHEGERWVCGAVDLSGTEDLADWPPADGCGSSFNTKASLEKHVRYVHLKVERPEQVSKKLAAFAEPTPNPSSVLEELAGVGQKTRRTIPCTIAGCKLKFAHDGELQGHVQSSHVVDSALLGDNDLDDNLGLGDAGWMPIADYLGKPFLERSWDSQAPVGSRPAAVWEKGYNNGEDEMYRLVHLDDLDGLIDPALDLAAPQQALGGV